MEMTMFQTDLYLLTSSHVLGLFSDMSGLVWPLAYIDPGAGSQLLQWLAAGLLASLYLLKMSWTHIKALVAQRFGKPDD